METPRTEGISFSVALLTSFIDTLRKRLVASAKNLSVAGFKSVVCYRTGLDVSAVPDPTAEGAALFGIYKQFQSNVPVRLADKPLNDLVVRTTLEVAAEYNKPGMVPFCFPSDSVQCPFLSPFNLYPLAVQFHTGLGDADITLTRASPAHLQPLIAANPQTIFVLLHASYPYMREGGYLTAVYKNVYFDIGEVFPAVSRGGQEALVRQVLELTPTNKIMWSSELRPLCRVETLRANCALAQVMDIGGQRHTTWVVCRRAARCPL